MFRKLALYVACLTVTTSATCAEIKGQNQLTIAEDYLTCVAVFSAILDFEKDRVRVGYLNALGGSYSTVASLWADPDKFSSIGKSTFENFVKEWGSIEPQDRRQWLGQKLERCLNLTKIHSEAIRKIREGK